MKKKRFHHVRREPRPRLPVSFFMDDPLVWPGTHWDPAYAKALTHRCTALTQTEKRSVVLKFIRRRKKDK